MTNQSHRPQLFLKLGCPHCLKFYIFLTEAGLSQRYAVMTFENNDATHLAIRKDITLAGLKPTFPALKTTTGHYKLDSDEMIAEISQEVSLDPDAMPLLQHYLEGVFLRLRELRQENKQLLNDRN